MVGGGKRLVLLDARTHEAAWRVERKDFVDACAFSPDGKAIACVSRSGAFVLDAGTGKERALEDTRLAEVVAWSPSGKAFATAGRDTSILVWKGE